MIAHPPLHLRAKGTWHGRNPLSGQSLRSAGPRLNMPGTAVVLRIVRAQPKLRTSVGCSSVCFWPRSGRSLESSRARRIADNRLRQAAWSASSLKPFAMIMELDVLTGVCR